MSPEMQISPRGRSDPHHWFLKLEEDEDDTLTTVKFRTTLKNMVDIEISSETIMPSKKKRNLPGMPDPDAEVVALSPESLVATNRFVCEVCCKGFQRDQNLQLHRRGHNLPWKLKQRSSDEPLRKRVYVCPETACVHHHPSRALGDLTGIKKHFSRKHGEKNHQCPRCEKKYAVQSDWKAHVKTCGTREYLCDCGTLFSRKDSFITHRSFCHASGPESARPRLQSEPTSATGDLKAQTVVAAAASPPPSTGVSSPVMSIHSSATELPENQNAYLQPLPSPQEPVALTTLVVSSVTTTATSSSTTAGTGGGALSTLLNSSTSEHSQSSLHQSAAVAPYPNLLCPMSGLGQGAIDPMYLSLSSCSSFYEPSSSKNPPQPLYLMRPQAALSATALLQKAAQVGSTSSNPSLLHGLGLALPSSSGSQCDHSQTNWNTNKVENNSFRLGLGLPSGGSSGLNELMMGPSGIFDGRPTTLDFLGLGMGVGEPSEGLSSFLSSISGDVNMAGAMSWDGSCHRKPSGL